MVTLTPPSTPKHMSSSTDLKKKEELGKKTRKAGV